MLEQQIKANGARALGIAIKNSKIISSRNDTKEREKIMSEIKSITNENKNLENKIEEIKRRRKEVKEE